MQLTGILFLASSPIGLALSIAGIIYKRASWLIIGGTLTLPVTLYIGASPAFWPWGFCLPLFQFGAAWAVHRGSIRLAWLLLLLPFAIVAGWILLRPFVDFASVSFN
jgi:hypothetical protein